MNLKRTARVMYGEYESKIIFVYGDSEVQGNVDAEYVKVYGNTKCMVMHILKKQKLEV